MDESEVKQEKTENEAVTFKKKRVRSVRVRRSSDESSGGSADEVAALEETRELQKLRRRPHGVSIVTLATGQKITVEEEATLKDPFKVKSGGLVNMSALKSGKVKQVDDAYDTGIGTQFSAETNKRDEDEEMMKYIDEQLAKRKGEVTQTEEGGSRVLPVEEAALLSLPEHLRTSNTHRSEEMLSQQMLSGIPEVDLGIDAKIRNIEATEEAKMRLMRERLLQRDAPSQFVPANVAVNFVQHNRFNLEPWKRRKAAETKRPASDIEAGVEQVVKKARGERASDDFHYEKFKKHFRRF